MSNLFRFTLTPKSDGRFFFGAEKSPFKEEYYLRSRQFPQQTSLLGMLRLLILQKKNLLNAPRQSWSDWIGATSFSANAGQIFGKIERLSPVCIREKDSGQEFFPCKNPKSMDKIDFPGDLIVNFNDGQPLLSSPPLFGKTVSNAGATEFYDQKDYAQFSLSLWDFGEKWMPLEAQMDENATKMHAVSRLDPAGQGIFYKSVRDGITKNYGGNPKEEGYFKTENWHLRSGFAFSFCAELDDSEIPGFAEPTDVFIGGDRHAFRMDIQQLSGMDFNAENGSGEIFVLLSDAVVDNTIYDNCQGMVSDTIMFRNINTTVTDTRFDKRPVLKWYRKNDPVALPDDFDASPGRVLLQKGSILIAKSGGNHAAQLAQNLRGLPGSQKAAFHKIGYNHFKRLHKLPS